MARQTIVEWLQSLPIPWLFGRTVGQADAAAWGGVTDSEIDRLRDAARQSFPDYAADDALPYVAGNRQLIMGPRETPADFKLRALEAWDAHARQGQPAELLAQLWYADFENAVIVTQNGRAYTLGSPPTPGVDPTGILVITELGPNSAIPASSWWDIDGRDEFTSRFQVLFPGASDAYPFGATSLVTWGRATFDGVVDSVAITWNNPDRFGSTDYEVLVGAPVVLSGSPAIVWEDSALRTPDGTTVAASAPFTGYVTVLAWETGQNPFANLSAAALSRLRTIIRRWKYGKCEGIIALVSGLMWGWPISNVWGGAGLVWGGETVTFEFEA